MKRLIVLATGLLAALAVTVAPAGAGQASSAANAGVCSGWETAGAAAFDSLGSLTANSSSARTAGNVTKAP